MSKRKITQVDHFKAGPACRHQNGECSSSLCICGNEKPFRKSQCDLCKTVKSSDKLILARIKVKWNQTDNSKPLFYEGIVKNVRIRNICQKEYEIKYDDGDKAWHNLEEEDWELISNSILTDLPENIYNEDDNLDGKDTKISMLDIDCIIGSYEPDQILTKRIIREKLEDINGLKRDSLMSKKKHISNLVNQYISDIEARDLDIRYVNLRKVGISIEKASDLLKYAKKNLIGNNKFRSLIANIKQNPMLKGIIEKSTCEVIFNLTSDDMKTQSYLKQIKEVKDARTRWLTLEDTTLE